MKGKFFAVTGAASGIGRETSLRLSQLGAAGIGISDINVEGLEETKNLCELSCPLEDNNAKVIKARSTKRKFLPPK